jgi:hypothetical protein
MGWDDPSVALPSALVQLAGTEPDSPVTRAPLRVILTKARAAWNGMGKMEWHYTATYGATKIGDHVVAITPVKLRDNRADADWYLVERRVEHAEIRDCLFNARRRGGKGGRPDGRGPERRHVQVPVAAA